MESCYQCYPEDLLEALDKWRMESAAVISRSELFRKAVEKYLDDERKRELEEKSRRRIFAIS